MDKSLAQQNLILIQKGTSSSKEDDVFNPALWFVTMDGDEIAGICLCRKREWEDPDMGWVNIFGVRR